MNLAQLPPLFLLPLLFTACSGGSSSPGGNLKRPDLPGNFQNRSTYLLQPGIQYLQASEQPIWDWTQHELSVAKPLPSRNFDVGTLLVGDDAAPFSARITAVLSSTPPLRFKVEALDLHQMLSTGDIDFRFTPDWRKASQAPAPSGGSQILPDGTIAFDNYILADLSIDGEGKIAPDNSILLNSPYFQKQRKLERIQTQQIRNGHIRITLTKGLLRIAPTGEYRFQKLATPWDARAQVSFALTLLYRFQIQLDTSGPMELALKDELLKPLRVSIPLTGLKARLELRVPLDLAFKSSSKTKTRFLFGRERELRVNLDFDPSRTGEPFRKQSSLLAFSELKDIQWDEKGKVSGAWSISPHCQLSFFEQRGPYLAFDLFARNQVGIPWGPDPNDLVIGFSGRSGIELGSSLTPPFLGIKQMDSPQLFAEMKGFDLLGPRGNPPPNTPPQALDFQALVPGGGGVLKLKGQDLNGDPLLYKILRQPDGGILSILDNHQGSLVYTPKDSFLGGDSFRYSVFDGKQQSEPAEVQIIVQKGSAPQPNFFYSSKAREIRVDATTSKDAETPSDRLLVRWDWTNDGTWDTEWLDVKEAIHVYPSPGSYVVKLQVMDSDRMTSSLTQTVLIGTQFTGSKTIVNSLGMTLRLIPAGTFWMGSFSTEPGRDPKNEERHKVTLTQPFYIGETEVTQAQWTSLMGTQPWKGKRHSKEGPTYPACYISWEDAVAFCEALSKKEGVLYRLPTEAEWERACRAGTNTIYSFGDDDQIHTGLRSHAWFFRNAWDRLGGYGNPHMVAKKTPNPWGLFDIHGNVSEPCSDYFGPYPKGPQTDPKGPAKGKYRVYRGGDILSLASACRSASRAPWSSNYRYFRLGLRVVRVAR